METCRQCRTNEYNQRRWHLIIHSKTTRTACPDLRRHGMQLNWQGLIGRVRSTAQHSTAIDSRTQQCLHAWPIYVVLHVHLSRHASPSIPIAREILHQPVVRHSCTAGLACSPAGRDLFYSSSNQCKAMQGGEDHSSPS